MASRGWKGLIDTILPELNLVSLLYRVLLGKAEGKRSLGRPRRRWEDNIKVDLHEVGCVDMDWIELAQDRDRWRAFANAVRKIRFP